METIFKISLFIHILNGFIALIVAPLAMITTKGGKSHRTWGKIFFAAMTLVTITALLMSVYNLNLFLLMLAVFSFYLSASGYRAIYRRHVTGPADVKATDWILVAVSGAGCLVLLLYGIFQIINSPGQGLGYIASVFGFIGLLLAVRDTKSFFIPMHHRKNWMFHHMGNMLGAYIATVSAFSAVNFSFLPVIIRWLWPTIIGVPLLILWIGKYRKKGKPAPLNG